MTRPTASQPPPRSWVAFRGAGKYARARALGDIAPPADDRARAGRCAGCPNATVEYSEAFGVAAVYCGAKFVELRLPEAPHPEASCGCLVAWVPGARAVIGVPGTPPAERKARLLAAAAPAGKTTVASEACPRGFWGSCTRAVMGGALGLARGLFAPRNPEKGRNPPSPGTV